MSAKSKTKRGKDGAKDTSPEPTPCTSHKSKRRRLSTDDEEDSGSPKRPSAHPTSKLGHNGLRSPSFTPHNKPAELFRKDLISAMKLADSEPLQQDYIFIADPWRQDWEKGVQVPVNPGEIPKIEVKQLYNKPTTGDFKIPRKYLHATQDDTYRQGIHELTGMQQLSEQVVRYDLDDLDVTWLELANEEREEMGLQPIHEWTVERVIEALESHCHEKIKDIMKTEEGLGIEYDEDIVCEVCRSPDSEETNEMVFCDGCDICVHQACYGIQNIPEGRWLCRTCSLGIKPTCILCPRTGGAMKSTKSGTKWAHVSCALWIPEVSIGCVEKMEPITKISNIPASRWALICCVCKDRSIGACIQCSVKTCKTAFHVTCAIFNGLEMKTILDDSDDGDGVKLKAFCPRHSKKRERSHSDSEQDSPRKEAPPTPRKDLSKEEVANLRAKKLSELQNDFHQVVDSRIVAEQLAVEEEVVELIMVFWKLKRKTNFDKPMLMPKTEEADMLEKQQEDSLVARMKMFVHLRQDLERVRNLCYMISRREKTKRQYYKAREHTFMAAVRALADDKLKLTSRDAEKLVKKYTTNCLYEGYDSQEKPKVVSRLSFSSESMLPSPHMGDDTESMDSDSRDVGVHFRSRLSSRASSTGKCDRESESRFLTEDSVKTFEKIALEKGEWKDELEFVDEKEEPETLSCGNLPERTRACDRSERHEKDNNETSGKEKHIRMSRRDCSEKVETKLDEEIILKLPAEKSEKSEKLEDFEKDQVERKCGRPKLSMKGIIEKAVSQAKVDSHIVDLGEKHVVKEKSERHGGKHSSEKTIGREKSERHWTKESRGGKGEKKQVSDSFKADKEEVIETGGGDADVSLRVGRERTRGRGKDKIKVEPDYESDFVDVMEVDPPVVSASFHPNIETKLDPTMPALEKVKIEEPAVHEVERPRRSLRENRQQIEMPKVDVSPTRHSSPEIVVDEEVVHPVRESKKQKHRRHGHRRHKRGEHRSSDRKRERNSSLSKEGKMTKFVKHEVNGVIRKSSKYVVENSVKERVQNKLLKSRRLRYINGVQDQSQPQIDNFFQAKSPEIGLNSVSSLSSQRTSSRILNEISPDKGKIPFENNLFGAHYTPKGSLSGYKIPKKGDSTERTPLKPQSSCEKIEEKESRSTRRKGEGGVKREIFADTGFDSLNTDSDFSKDVELVSDSRGYRSNSPLSSAGTDVSDLVRHSPSREGTPRRVTRSQHLDVDENSVDSVHSTRSNMKLRLGEGWLRPSKFSS